jgi:vacuolar-type H+-ATPase catalytic subunit A/Vma1
LSKGIMGASFDGIQRPLDVCLVEVFLYLVIFFKIILQEIASTTGSIYVPRGVDVPSLDRQKMWNLSFEV